jgi:hypothetical protein
MSHQYSGPDFRFPQGDARLDFTDLYVFPNREILEIHPDYEPGDGGGWIQVERGARPAQAVLLVEEREAYLGGEPADDGRFLAAFAHALEHTGGYTPAEARRVAGTLLPDVLPNDPTRPAPFPDNGRTLTDDGFDCVIRVLTNERSRGTT